MMKLIVAGGRDFTDYKLLCEKLDYLLSKRKPGEVTILCGGARGADTLGDRYASDRGIGVEYFPANWDNLDVTPCIVRYRNGKPYNALAGNIRNKQMADAGTHLVAFHDKISKGTKDMIDLANREGLVVKVINY